jgi:hypothetical protein
MSRKSQGRRAVSASKGECTPRRGGGSSESWAAGEEKAMTPAVSAVGPAEPGAVPVAELVADALVPEATVPVLESTSSRADMPPERESPVSRPAAELLRRPFETGAAARRNICGRRARARVEGGWPVSEWFCWKESNSVRRWFRLRRKSTGWLELRSMTAGREMPSKR